METTLTLFSIIVFALLIGCLIIFSKLIDRLDHAINECYKCLGKLTDFRDDLYDCKYNLEKSTNRINDICECHDNDVKQLKAEAIARAVLGVEENES